MPFGPGPPPTGTIDISGTQTCDSTPTLAITKKAKFSAKDVKDVDSAVDGCPTKNDKVSSLRWTISAGDPTSSTSKSVNWKAADTPSAVSVKLEGDDDGKVADDGGFMTLDTKTVNVVIPSTDTSSVFTTRGCAPGQTGRADIYSAVVKYNACSVKFSGLETSERDPQIAVTMDTCHLGLVNHSGGGRSLIDSSNKYCCDQLGLCSGGDPVIPAGGCIWQNQTQWRIGPSDVNYVVHTNTFNIPAGNSASHPPGGYGHLTTTRVP